jgi:hypothetical protein
MQLGPSFVLSFLPFTIPPLKLLLSKAASIRPPIIQ